MREIKFRAFDQDQKKWIYFDLDEAVAGVVQGLNMIWDDASVTQYTGFKDKNGQDIFEGDVVAVDNCKEPQEIIWYKWGAWHLKGGVYELGFSNPHIRMEVMGNIYENPELLG